MWYILRWYVFGLYIFSWYVFRRYILRWYVWRWYTFSVPVSTTTKKIPETESIFWCLIFVFYIYIYIYIYICACAWVCRCIYTHFCKTCNIIFSTTKIVQLRKIVQKKYGNVCDMVFEIFPDKSPPRFFLRAISLGHTQKKCQKVVYPTTKIIV